MATSVAQARLFCVLLWLAAMCTLATAQQAANTHDPASEGDPVTRKEELPSEGEIVTCASPK